MTYTPPLAATGNAIIESAFIARIDDWCGRLLLPRTGESGELELHVDGSVSLPKCQWLFTTSREFHTLKFLLRCEEDVVRPQTVVWVGWKCVMGVGGL